MIRTGNRVGNRTAIRTCVDTTFSYCRAIRITIQFAANCTAIHMGNRIRVDGPLKVVRRVLMHCCCCRDGPRADKRESSRTGSVRE
jgi:hypothetical protein